MSLMSPNHDIAFLVASGYTSVSALAGGMVVTFSNMWEPMQPLQYISMLKYPYQATLQLYFMDNPNTRDNVGRPVEEVLYREGLITPNGVVANWGVMLGMYVMFSIGGFFALKYLYRERR